MSDAAVVSAAALHDLRRARRRQRVAEIHWVDALYHAYLAGLGALALVIVTSTVVGDEPLTASAVARVRADGPAVLGLVAALAVGVGLRSGSRGGPLAIEAADLRHVLLSPVDRATALRGPALRQLRFAAFVAVVVGGTVGLFASRRFEQPAIAWIGTGILYALTVVALAMGSALVASGRRVPRWAATAVATVLAVWSIAEVAGAVPWSPATPVGRLGLWPLHVDPLGLIPVAVALALVAVGLLGIAGTSLEAAERRASLVGQLRFAVTLQDIRTAMVLRRQLAADLPRSRPWLVKPAGTRVRRPARWPVWQRGWRGVLRFPAGRVARMVGLAVAVGFLWRAVWGGSVALIAPAALVLWVLALDAVEPLSQEIDHPSQRDSYPIDAGIIHVQHLAVPAVVVSLLAGVAAAVASVQGGVPADVALLCVLPAGLGAVAGATISVVQGAPAPFDELSLASPEFAGGRTFIRTAWPIVVAAIGSAPLAVAARVAADGGDPAKAVSAFAPVVATLVVLVAAWVRFHDELHAWWDEAMEAAKTGRPPGSDTDDEDDT